MYVDHQHRSQGYGEQILLQLIQEAIHSNATELILETSQQMKAAIGLYKKHGFEAVNIQPESPRCDITFRKMIS